MRVWLENTKFENPADIIECHRLSEIEDAFAQMEKALAKGFYLAGFLSYEAGYAFEKIFRDDKKYDFPLLRFGAFVPESLTRPTHNLPPSPFGRGVGGEGFSLSFSDYFDSMQKIKKHLTAGNTYQVNYTFKYKFDFRGSPLDLYRKLKIRQPTPYSAFIETKDFSILSLSPELFFQKKGSSIKVKPMKGTIAPGRGNAGRLKTDPKNRSENIMIVDLLRNDLGRIAKTGTVKTTRLFEVEKLPTLYQMTSTVEAEIPRDIYLYDLFRNIFPSGSVTGAPKISTMRIIRELEKEERKIYTGSIGFITPQRDMVFNVAIRTVLLENNEGEMGIGSGIVYDSDPEKEFEECLLKAKFLL